VGYLRMPPAISASRADFSAYNCLIGYAQSEVMAMAPECTTNLVTLDLKIVGSEVECEVDRFDLT
jgi:hypothetical protein